MTKQNGVSTVVVSMMDARRTLVEEGAFRRVLDDAAASVGPRRGSLRLRACCSDVDRPPFLR